MLSNGQEHLLKISDIGSNGEGIAKVQGFTVFVDDALPEEIVLGKIEKLKPNYALAKNISLKEFSRHRVSPPCKVFTKCGGCQIMHYSYSEQLRYKENMVRNALLRIGKQIDPQVLPCISSPNQFNYRNKIQLPVSMANNRVVMGFYQKGTHNIVPYDNCMIHCGGMEEIAKAVYKIISKSQVKPYLESSKRGTLRHIVIRSNIAGKYLIGLVTTGKQTAEIDKIAKSIFSEHKNIVGVVESINKKSQNTIIGDYERTICGSGQLLENINGINFKISLPSFFQVNLKGAKVIYDTALSFADMNDSTHVLDAYCGIGTLSLLAAKKAKHVLGVECVKKAIDDARENAKINKIDNASFIAGKVEEQEDLFSSIDVAFINPPRKGIDINVVRALKQFGPKKLIYISCNPSTLARDILLLKDRYQLIKAQPIDMFPHTTHVETVALLISKS